MRRELGTSDATSASVLARVIERARTAGPTGVVAFDLDSTLFDNRPRQVRIVREFGAARGIPPLTRNEIHHWTSGWDLLGAVVACGLPRDQAAALLPDLKPFWKERFFTSEYCQDDVPIPGAPEFTHRVLDSGAVLAYLTGRHEAMRAGTEVALRRGGIPLPGGSVHLLMKPTAVEDDDAFKVQAHQELSKLGTVLAAFDNEPTHVNDYRRSFPQAIAVHLATDHSGRPVTLLDGIESIPDFRGST